MRSRVLLTVICLVVAVAAFLLGRVSVEETPADGDAMRPPRSVEDIRPNSHVAAEEAAERGDWDEATEHYRRAVSQHLLNLSDALAGEFDSAKAAGQIEHTIAVSNRAISLLSDWEEYGYDDHQAQVQHWVLRKARLIAAQRGSDWESVLRDWAQERSAQGACSEFTLIMRIEEKDERAQALKNFVADRTSGYWVGRALSELGWEAAMDGDSEVAAEFYERAIANLPPFYDRMYQPLVDDPDKILEMHEYEAGYERYKAEQSPR